MSNIQIAHSTLGGIASLKILLSVLVLHLGADKRGPLLNRRFLLGVARTMDKIGKIGWFTRREGFVG